MAGLTSFDPDHALAILLQAKFNEEAKKKSNAGKENKFSPAPLSRPAPRSSLTDPEWEVTDPCPDIHGLFLSFNDRFFWGRLQRVVVKWSPRMTSCAGICVYEGHNGLCSVRLSAPLLKLRPRSDLVETLLHEMIHAYLFVTNNNRDREGHGPEFHKHMNRINKEAGTNITVYHSFHAEVKLYQQHWWRCQGQCQSRPPFFGMVKRAMDRAPGPTDIWWADHQAKCGGTFVKVREPEGFQKKGKSGKAQKPADGKDIRNFFKKPSSANNGSLPATVTSNKVGSNIFGFNNLPNSNSSQSSVQSPVHHGEKTFTKRPTSATVTSEKVGSNIFGFNNLPNTTNVRSNVKSSAVREGGGHILGQSNDKLPKVKGPISSGKGGMLANRGGGTLVVTGSQGKTKQPDTVKSPDTKLRIDKFKVFTGNGFTLGSASSINDRSRSRLLSLGQEENSPKKQKIDEISQKNKFLNGNEDSQMCKCSVCGGSVSREEVDIHLESCEGLKNVFNNSFFEDKSEENEIIEINKKYKTAFCPVCNQSFTGDINAHLDECLDSSGFLNLVENNPVSYDLTIHSPKNSVASQPKCNTSDSDVEIIEPEGRVACPICGMRFGESRINDHVNTCLDSETNVFI